MGDGGGVGAASDFEGVTGAGRAFEIGGERGAFIGEVAGAIITLVGAIVGEVEVAPGGGGEIRRGLVGGEAIEDDEVTGGGGDFLEGDALKLLGREGFEAFADPAAFVVAEGEFEAAVGDGAGVDGDEDGDEVGGVVIPAGLDILVGGEALAAGHLEVDFFLKEGGGRTEELSADFGEAGGADHGAERLVFLDEFFDALEDLLGGVGDAGFKINHFVADAGGPGDEGIDRGARGGDFGGGEVAGDDECAIAFEGGDLRGGELHGQEGHGRVER